MDFKIGGAVMLPNERRGISAPLAFPRCLGQDLSYDIRVSIKVQDGRDPYGGLFRCGSQSLGSCCRILCGYLYLEQEVFVGVCTDIPSLYVFSKRPDKTVFFISALEETKPLSFLSVGASSRAIREETGNIFGKASDMQVDRSDRWVVKCNHYLGSCSFFLRLPSEVGDQLSILFGEHDA
jgi:hypothetical protein